MHPPAPGTRPQAAQSVLMVRPARFGFNPQPCSSNRFQQAPQPGAPDLAASAGKKGGQNVEPSKRSFSANRELAVSAGAKGGQTSRGGRGASGSAGGSGSTGGSGPSGGTGENGSGEYGSVAYATAGGSVRLVSWR